jgi:predicted TIM-barrel enzyme
MDVFLKDLRHIGFSGVQNFPTVGLCDGLFRANLEETGMGYDLEVDMIAQAHELGLLTTPYVFSEENARKMTRAGADVLVAHAGLTTNGTVGARSGRTLEETVDFVQSIADTAKSERDDILVICHGGPLAEPDEVEYVLRRTSGVSGFFGASSVERLPTEFAITDQVRKFKQIDSAASVVTNDRAD